MLLGPKGGTWQVAAEVCCPIYHAGGARGLVLVGVTFRDVNSGGAPLAHFSASNRMEEDSHYDIRLSSKPFCRDHVGHPVSRLPDNPGVAHFAVRNPKGLAPIAGAALPDWTMIL